MSAGDRSAAPNVDQRGMARVLVAAVDLGAVESQKLLFTSFSFSGPGGFQLQFNGDPAAGYSVVGSTDASLALSNWVYLGPATQLSNGLFQYNDAQATNYPLRYYRVREP